MDFADRTLTCRDCGKPFTWTAGEQAFYSEKGLVNEPARCPECRCGPQSPPRPRTAADDAHDRLRGVRQETTVPFVPRNGNRCSAPRVSPGEDRPGSRSPRGARARGLIPTSIKHANAGGMQFPPAFLVVFAERRVRKRPLGALLLVVLREIIEDGFAIDQLAAAGAILRADQSFALQRLDQTRGAIIADSQAALEHTGARPPLFPHELARAGRSGCPRPVPRASSCSRPWLRRPPACTAAPAQATASGRRWRRYPYPRRMRPKYVRLVVSAAL